MKAETNKIFIKYTWSKIKKCSYKNWISPHWNILTKNVKWAHNIRLIQESSQWRKYINRVLWFQWLRFTLLSIWLRVFRPLNENEIDMGLKMLQDWQVSPISWTYWTELSMWLQASISWTYWTELSMTASVCAHYWYCQCSYWYTHIKEMHLLKK